MMNKRTRQCLILAVFGTLVYVVLKDVFQHDRLKIIKSSNGDINVDINLAIGPGFSSNDDKIKEDSQINMLPHTSSGPTVRPISFKGMTYLQALQSVTSNDSNILMALIDGGFLDMAFNFYETCIEAFNVENYLFIGSDERTCERMSKMRINCYVYRVDKDAGMASEYLSKSFLRKMNVRTDMILDALNHNYSVLHTDIDMYCYKHPINHIDCKVTECDIAALQDTSVYNAGFIYVNPTLGSKAVYKKMQDIARKSPSVDDQSQLNTAIRQQKHADSNFVAKKLNSKHFLCGLYFYENPKRFFAGKGPSCTECVIVHNNWIVSMEAKVYRERELHQWTYDGDNKYYSSTTRKYLKYSNPVIGTSGAAKQMESLRHAFYIGHLLNRTVILPTFNCPTKGDKYYDCPLNSLVNMAAFDKQFRGLYKESSFLQHPKVPTDIVQKTSPSYIITSQYVVDNAKDKMADTTIQKVEPHNYTIGMTDEDILRYFKENRASVLHFTGLYDAFDRILDEKKHLEFSTKIKAGFKPSCYRQYSWCKKWSSWLSTNF